MEQAAINAVARFAETVPLDRKVELLTPGKGLQFTVPAGASGAVRVDPSVDAYLLTAVLYGADTFATTLDNLPWFRVKSDPSKTAAAVSAMFTAKDCVTQMSTLATSDVSSAHAVGEFVRNAAALALSCLATAGKVAYGLTGSIASTVFGLLTWASDGVKLVYEGGRAAWDTALYVGGYQLQISQMSTGNSPPATEGGGQFTVTTAPSDTVREGGSSVSCTTNGFCMTVGTTPFSGVLNSDTWSTVPAPMVDSPQMRSVSCVSSTFCMAVGKNSANDKTIWLFDGYRWRLGPHPTPNRWMGGVACVSESFCLAGSTEDQIFTWNGTSWSVPDSSVTRVGSIVSMSCLNRGFCVASVAGAPAPYYAGAGFSVMFYTGAGWTPKYHLSADLDPNTVGCLSTSECFALDDGGNVWAYNGGSWTPVPQKLKALTCLPGFCFGIDTNSQAVVSTGGSTWSGPLSAPPSAPQHISSGSAASCSSPTRCVVVGGPEPPAVFSR